MTKEYITHDSKETQELGKILAEELRGGEVICLSGDLGAGKTTFTQGLLKGLGVKGPYTSPTFLIIKQYHIAPDMKRKTNTKKILKVPWHRFYDIYHIDAYRVGAEDVSNLGWQEIISTDKNVTIIEWADRVRDIIPSDALWINFKWLDEKKRKIIFNSK